MKWNIYTIPEHDSNAILPMSEKKWFSFELSCMNIWIHVEESSICRLLISSIIFCYSFFHYPKCTLDLSVFYLNVYILRNLKSNQLTSLRVTVQISLFRPTVLHIRHRAILHLEKKQKYLQYGKIESDCIFVSFFLLKRRHIFHKLLLFGTFLSLVFSRITVKSE